MRRWYLLTFFFTSQVTYAMEKLVPTNLIGPDELVATAPKAPIEIEQEAQEWIQKHRKLLDLIVHFPPEAILIRSTQSCDPMYMTIAVRTQEIERESLRNGLKSLSKHSYVYQLPKTKALIKLASLESVFRNTLSAYGYHPYLDIQKSMRKMGGIQGFCDAANMPGNFGLYRRDLTLRHVKALSALAYYRLITLHRGTAIQAPATYAVHIPDRPPIADDRNYVIVQEQIASDVMSFKTLGDETKAHIISNLPLEDIYKENKEIGLWNLSAGNVFIDIRSAQPRLMVRNLEMPNEEGYALTPFYGVAVFGKVGTQAREPHGKWRINVDTGCGTMAQWLNTNKKQSELWEKLRENDPSAHEELLLEESITQNLSLEDPPSSDEWASNPCF